MITQEKFNAHKQAVEALVDALNQAIENANGDGVLFNFIQHMHVGYGCTMLLMTDIGSRDTTVRP